MNHNYPYSLLIIVIGCISINHAVAQSITPDTILARQLRQPLLSAPSSDGNNADNFNTDKRVLQLQHAEAIYQEHQLYPQLIEVQGEIALAFVENKNYAASKSYIDKAIGNAHQHLDTLHPSMAYSYFALQGYHHLRNPQQAISYGQLALKLLPIGSDKHARAWIYLLKDNARLNFGAKEQLASAVKQISNGIQEGKLPKSYQTIYYFGQMKTYGIAYLSLEKSIVYGQQCVLSNDSTQLLGRQLSVVYRDIGVAYGQLSRLDEALKYMKLSLNAANLPLTHPDMGNYYQDLASINYFNGRYNEAIDALQNAIQVYWQDTTAYTKDIALAYRRIGLCYMRAGNNEQAILEVEESLNYSDNMSARDAYARGLGRAGYYERGLVQSQKVIGASCEGVSKTDYKSNPSRYSQNTIEQSRLGTYLCHKAFLLMNAGATKQDTSMIHLSIETANLSDYFYEKAMMSTYGYEMSILSNQLILYKNAMIRAAAYEELYRLRPAEDSRQSLFTSKQQLNAFSIFTGEATSLPDDVQQQQNQLIDRRNTIERKIQLKAQMQPDSLAAWQNQLFGATQQLDDFNSRLLDEYALSRLSRDANRYPTLKEVQDMLTPNEAIITYTGRVEGKMDIMLITKRGFITMIKVADVDSIKAQAQFVSEFLKDPFNIQRSQRQAFVEASHALYNALLRPIASELEGMGIEQLIIIPEKNQFNLPFEVLLPTRNVKMWNELDFLIKKYAISYHYSAITWLETQKRAATTNGALLAFAPVFGNGISGYRSDSLANHKNVFSNASYRAIREDGSFSPLPNTETEVKTISQIVGGKTILLLKSNATKSTLENALTNSSYQFVHIATHGLINMQNPNLSALACASNSNNAVDAFYFTDEIKRKPMQVDLVVLSSCESGVGTNYSAGGPVAFNRSFIFAGARNVLFSLQKVEDQFTSRLMTNFYKHYYGGMTYSDALRAAKLDALNNALDANPHYWSPFVLMGR